MKPSILLALLILCGCSTSGNKGGPGQAPHEPDPGPPVTLPDPPPTTNEYEGYTGVLSDDMTALINQHVKTYPEDQQAHVAMSKSLMWLYPTKSDTAAGDIIESMIRAYAKGYEREVGQAGANMAIMEKWDQIAELLVEIDKFTERHLNEPYHQNDMLANIVGITSVGCIAADGARED